MIRFSQILAAMCLAVVSSQAQAAQPSFKKVMIVIFENMDYREVINEPFFGGLAKNGANLAQFFAETHPSQPNYIALTSGSMQGVRNDSNVDLNVKHIADLLEAHGKTWKAYVEAWPGKCFTGARSGTYARKHNPFISYLNIQRDSNRCNEHIVSASQLMGDISTGNLPDYSFYVPDMNNDGHDTDASFADRWYGGAFGPLLKDPKFTKDLLLITTFDESSRSGGQHIYTTLWGDSVIPGSVAQARYDHYSILRTIEDQFGLGTLGLEDARATPISGIWK